METTLRYDRQALERLCRERHVRRLDLFGSRAKGTADGESDVDLLVEYEPGHTPGLLGFLELEEELAALFGEKVDLVSSGGLSPYLKEERRGALSMRDDLVYLMHIRDSLHEVRQFIEDESYESFLENRMVQNAVMRSFEVVGASARGLDESIPMCRGG